MKHWWVDFYTSKPFQAHLTAQLEWDDASLTWTGKIHEDFCSMRTAGDTAPLVSTEGAWKVLKYRTSVLSTNTPEKNLTFASFTITLSSKWVKYKRLGFHLHPQINSKQGGLWISYIICLLVTQGQSTALQREPKLWYWKQVTVLPSLTLKSSLQLRGFLSHGALQN